MSRLGDEDHRVGAGCVLTSSPVEEREEALVALGVYDHTHFHRVEPGFVLQLADVSQREEKFALTPE